MTLKHSYCNEYSKIEPDKQIHDFSRFVFLFIYCLVFEVFKYTEK